MLVFRVEGGGGDQRKVTTPKTSEALVSGLGGGGWWVSKGSGDENEHSLLVSGLGVVAGGFRRVVVTGKQW